MIVHAAIAILHVCYKYMHACMSVKGMPYVYADHMCFVTI